METDTPTNTPAPIQPLRILLIWSAADWSTYDQSQGYYDAFTHLGHTVHPFKFNERLNFWSESLEHWAQVTNTQPPPIEAVLREASDWALPMAARFQPDLVLITSAMGFHPDAIHMLTTHGYRTALALSECPYDDAHHIPLAPLVNFVFCNDKLSVPVLGQHNTNTHYLPTAYNTQQHKPGLDPTRFSHPHCDVLFVGTGFPERQRFLESAMSLLRSELESGLIDLQLYGFWSWKDKDPDKSYDIAESWLAPFIHPAITNDETAARYCGAKIVLNFYRDGFGYSLNPRAYEIAACGAFQLAQDGPKEAHEVFGDTIGYFSTPQQLAQSIRFWLSPQHVPGRYHLARKSQERVAGHSYIDRARRIIDLTGIGVNPPVTLSSGQGLTYGIHTVV